MTVSSSTSRVSYSGNGSLTAFAYTFKIFDEGDLTVILRASDGTETVQTITTHYTVSGVGDDGGGNVTFGTAPASGVTVVILREQPLTQGLDLVPNDPFPANSLEEALDKIVFMTQKHEEELGRAIKASRTNVITGSEFTISASDRANKIFAFDSSGDVSITQEIGTFRGDWAASTAYEVRDLVKDTSTNNIFIVNSAHTSSGAQPLTTNANSAKYDLIVDAASSTTAQTAAAASATAAAASETAAAASESAAATSETNAANSATASASSATSAAASYDNFDDRYLGAKSTSGGNPTVDNDGDALIDGALFFDTTNNVMMVYNLGTTTWLRTTPTSTDQSSINTVNSNATNINTVAGQISPTNNIATLAGISSNITTVAGDTTEIGVIATDLNGSDTIGTVAGIASNVTTVAGISSEVSTLSGKATEIGLLGVSSVITDMSILGTADVVADMAILGTADVVSDMNLLGTSANVTAMSNVSGSIANVNTVSGDLSGSNTIGTVAGSITNVNNTGGSIANVNIVATNLSSINTFANQYVVSGSTPSSPNEGLLWFDTSSDTMKVYNGNSFQNAGSSVNGTSERVNYVVGTSSGSYNGSTTVFPATYDPGFLDVFLNGVRLDPADFTATNGTSVTLGTAATSGDTLGVVAFGTFILSDHYSKTASDARYAALSGATFTGDVSGTNVTLSGYLRGPSTFTIDPAAHGDNSGTLVIAGNLQVDGTTTTVNSTTMEVDDLNITVASGAANASAANGAGITVDGANATMTYNSTGDNWEFNKPINLGTWTVTESGGSLYFAVSGVNKMKLDASGNLDVVGNVNTNATIS